MAAQARDQFGLPRLRLRSLGLRGSSGLGSRRCSGFRRRGYRCRLLTCGRREQQVSLLQRAWRRPVPRPWRSGYSIEEKRVRRSSERAAGRRLAGERRDLVLWFLRAFSLLPCGADPTSSSTLSFSSLAHLSSGARVTSRCDRSHKIGVRLDSVCQKNSPSASRDANGAKIRALR